MFNHEAIRSIYPNAVAIVDGENGGVFDADGNPIELDNAAIEAATISLLEGRAWSDLRKQRTKLLADSDWVVLKAIEGGVEAQSEWLSYRQALRDLPANTEDPRNPAWPVKPGG